MDNKISNTVTFDRDLHIKFDANLIDNLKVFNPMTQKKGTCEHWGWEDEEKGKTQYYDFGRIGEFDFSIYKTHTKFYFGWDPIYGYVENKPEELIFINDEDNPENFIKKGSFNFYRYYPTPKTMWDLAMFIDSFYTEMQLFWENIRIEHAKIISKQSQQQKDNVNKYTEDDLPF